MVTMANKLDVWLQKELGQRGWSQRELARRAGISHAIISEVLSGTKKPGWDFCLAIADPLDRSPIEMFRLAGLLPSDKLVSEDQVGYYAQTLTTDEVVLLSTYRQLPAHGKRTVRMLSQGLADQERDEEQS
jgi:transcriptional regulator with XRE-family HTH domain